MAADDPRKAAESEAASGGARVGIAALRRICLALPEAHEVEAWGDPTFRVRNKIFAMPKTGDGRLSLWLKAPPGDQQILVSARPETFFVPPYVGHHGWIGVRLDAGIDGDEVADLVEASYRLTAPRRLVARLADRG
jgi:predicted DNA-binding protein (MmcQ/YjbR family)